MGVFCFDLFGMAPPFACLSPWRRSHLSACLQPGKAGKDGKNGLDGEPGLHGDSRRHPFLFSC